MVKTDDRLALYPYPYYLNINSITKGTSNSSFFYTSLRSRG